MFSRRNAGQIASSLNRRALIRRAVIDTLESRVLFCLDHDALDATGQLASQGAIGSLPFNPPSFAAVPAPLPVATNPLSSIPELNSLPGATAKIYLDFNGQAANTWGQFNVPVTPAFDLDNDASTFSNSELSTIQQIYNRVAEMFSPFNINVTTVDPGNSNNNETIRSVFGGTGSWLGAQAGGVAYVGAFYNSAPNIVWAFSKNLGTGAKTNADAAAHEIGHAFGLQHQSVYSGTTRTLEYNPGNSARAPIMGVSYNSTRGLWWTGQSAISSTTIQNDLAVLTNNTNGFGYRADDHGNTAAAQSPLTVDGNSVSASGILTTTADVDAFAFSTLAGDVSLTVSVPTGGMLDATLRLLDSNGATVTTIDTTSLSETLALNLQAGDYTLLVLSKGAQGDIGQYSIAGTVVTSPDYVAAPGSVAASGANGEVSLTWSDRSYNELSFVIERSDDGGGTWTEITTTDADITEFVDDAVTVGSSYRYRIFAQGPVETSNYSTAVTVGVAPSAPSNLAAATANAAQINLSWTDTAGETGYRVERSLNNSTWTLLTTTAADATSYSSTALVAGTLYYYRITSVGGAGNSSPTSSVSATTVTAAPSTLAGTATTTSIALSWTNVAGETGYRVEQSTDGGSTWSQLASTAVNIVTYSHTGLDAGTTYRYRVIATNAGGDSAASAVLTRSTKTLAPTSPTGSAASATTVNISWTDVAGETSYRIERQSGTSWVAAATADADATTAAVVSALAGGTSYNFRVIALNDGGASSPSSTVNVLTIPAAPVLTAVAASTGQINLAWTNVAGETGYTLEHSDDGGATWTSIATPAMNIASSAHTGLDTDSAHSYRVRASNASGNGQFSSTASTRTLLAAPNDFTATVNSTTQITLNWAAIDGATGYKIEQLRGTTWSLLTSPAAVATSHVVVGLTAGTGYAYRLRAQNAGGPSLPSAAATVTTIPAAPVLSGTATATSVNLSWTNVAGETGYELQRSTDGGSTWTDLNTTAVNIATYLNANLDSNSTYTYRVRAVNAAGNGAYSAAVSKITLLPAPTNLAAAVNSSTQITLTWDATANATAYKLERLSGTTWSAVAAPPASATSLVITGLAAGTGYSYRLSAQNAGGFSLPSTAATALTIPAAPVLAGTATAVAVNLSWNNVAGETGYELQRSTDGGDTWNALNTTAANVATYANGNLDADTTYKYRVRAINASGNGAYSAVLTKITLLPAPTNVTSTATTTTVSLAWTEVDGAQGYKVERQSGTTWVAVATPSTAAQTISGLTAGTGYNFRVSALGFGGYSAVTVKSVVTIAPAPASLTAVKPTATSAKLTWTNVAGETGFIVQRSTDNNTWTTLLTTAANVLTYTQSALTSGTYYYRVLATNASGNSAASPTATVTVA